MNKKMILGGAAALVLAAAIVTPTMVEAYQGDPNVQGPNCTSERHEAMTRAFEDKDYNAWKELMSGRGRVTQVINEGNFARFAEMHKLRLEGKTDEANRIRTELGLGLGNGAGTGKGFGRNANR